MNRTELTYQRELQLFHQASRIPLCVFDNTPKDILRYPGITSMNCASTTLLLLLESIRKHQTAPYLPILYSSDSCFFALSKLDEQTNVMFGPVSSVPLSYREFYNTNRIECELDDLLHLYRITQQSPHITLSQFAGNLALFVQLAFQEKVSAEMILANHIYYPVKPQKEFAVSDVEPHYVTIGETIDFQKKILHLMKEGKVHEIDSLFEHTPLFTNLEQTPSSTEDFKNIFLIYATLCCITALESKVALEKAFPIFDTYLSKAPSIVTSNNLATLCQQLTLDYCNQILSLQPVHSDSPIISKCLHYIHENIYSRITVSDLAQHCNVSTRTITRHFSDYYHIPVTEYIINCKLEEAAFLLTHSSFSLTEISSLLAFSSQSHLTVAFKKKYSYTPQKYRDKFIENN